jgi:hypothetical protein
MLDRFMRRLVDPALERAGRRLAGLTLMSALARVVLAWQAFRDNGENE